MTTTLDFHLEADRREYEIQRLFIEFPELSEFFYKATTQAPPKAQFPVKKRSQLYAVAEIMLRYCEFLSRVSKDCTDASWAPRIARMRFVWEQSTFLRKFYAKHAAFFPALSEAPFSFHAHEPSE